jgi:YegS/Rv2252/BmrU family lipid kinase
MKKIAFIAQGKIKHLNKHLADIKQVFAGHYEIAFFITERKAHAIELASQAVNNGFEYIICIGGDGSANEVTNGIMDAQNRAQNVFMGLLPMGTGNDFAKTMHVNNNLHALKQLIDNNQYQVIDLGLANYTNTNGKQASRYFINITDTGMGGIAAEKLNSYSKLLGSTISFQRAIISTLLTYRNQQVEVKADSFTYNGSTLNFIIANGKYFGSGLGIAPHANPTDGEFAIVIAAEISIWDYLKNLGTVRKCKKVEHPQLMYKSAKTITIQSPEGPMPIDMDGEFIGYTPMQVSIVPGAIKFLSAL